MALRSFEESGDGAGGVGCGGLRSVVMKSGGLETRVGSGQGRYSE